MFVSSTDFQLCAATRQIKSVYAVNIFIVPLESLNLEIGALDTLRSLAHKPCVTPDRSSATTSSFPPLPFAQKVEKLDAFA